MEGVLKWGMKKYSQLAVALAVVLVPLMAQAAAPVSSFISRETYSAGTQHSGDLYVSSENATVDSRVDGDLFMLGGTLNMTGTVTGDVAALGGSVQILGSVMDDVRIAGGQVTVRGDIQGDLLVAGGSVQVLPGATVHGDVYVLGGKVIIDGHLQGGVHMAGGRMTINGSVDGDVRATASDRVVLGSKAVVGGALAYRAPRELEIADGAKIAGAVSYEPVSRVHVNRETPKAVVWGLIVVLTGVKMLALLGMTALVVWLWRRPALEVLQETKEGFGRMALRGLVFMLLTPVAVVLLLISFVGIIPGVLLALVYAGILVIAKALSGMFLGAWLTAAYKKRSALQVTWVNALSGVILIEVFSLIPVIGWIAKVVIVLALFGVLTVRVQQRVS
jgi:cytoskeletal protein CcmA (bactofilin family)